MAIMGSTYMYVVITTGAAPGCLIRGGKMIQCCTASPDKVKTSLNNVFKVFFFFFTNENSMGKICMRFKLTFSPVRMSHCAYNLEP